MILSILSMIQNSQKMT